MKKFAILILSLLSLGCKEEPKVFTAQEIVDAAIEEAGGEVYEQSHVSFNFRDTNFVLERRDGRRILKRVLVTDTAVVVDRLSGDTLSREINEKPVLLPDSLRTAYRNSVNSVHYFAYLPQGLNDAAVNKELLGTASIGDQEYHKVKITFDQEGGGDDYQDIFVYWFNKETLTPDFIAYEYHTDGGGLRFREAFNERRVNGMRFVDYRNYKPKNKVPVTSLDSLFVADELELLSVIELKDVDVNRQTLPEN